MFRVAICDDEQSVCRWIEKVVGSYLEQMSYGFEIQRFYSAEELWTFLSTEYTFDLIFLDIMLKLMDGVEVGRKIRNELCDEWTQIVYISAEQGYAMDLFESRPLNFLIKPFGEKQIIRCLIKAFELSRKSDTFFAFSLNSIHYKIPYKKIICFQSDNRKINIITVDDVYEYYGKLSDIIRSVPDAEFLQIHKSYLVNYTHIKANRYDRLNLTGGIELPISQSYRKTIRDILTQKRKNGV